jgi:hypothetical protein
MIEAKYEIKTERNVEQENPHVSINTMLREID